MTLPYMRISCRNLSESTLQEDIPNEYQISGGKKKKDLKRSILDFPPAESFDLVIHS